MFALSFVRCLKARGRTLPRDGSLLCFASRIGFASCGDAKVTLANGLHSDSTPVCSEGFSTIKGIMIVQQKAAMNTMETNQTKE